jgi:ankyrin repeat protein
VQHGADPNDVFVDEKGKAHNLLMDAIVVSNKEYALLLIEKGANVTYANPEGVTVTTQAAYQGELAVVEALLAKGVDITVANNEGIDPLIAAASEGHHDVVKALLASGRAAVNAKDKDGTNALMGTYVHVNQPKIFNPVSTACEINSIDIM